MAEDEKGLQPIAEILSSHHQARTQAFHANPGASRNRETASENLSTPSPRAPHRLPPSRC